MGISKEEESNLKDKDTIEGEYIKLDGAAPDLEGKMIGHALQKKSEKAEGSKGAAEKVMKFAPSAIGAIIKGISLLSGL